MTDYLKKTPKETCVANEAMKELHKASTEATVAEAIREINEGIKEVAAKFNFTRAELATLVTLAKGFEQNSKEFVLSTVALRHGDYGHVIRTEQIKKNLEVEEAGGFAETLRYAESRITPATRVRACVETNNKIAECIESWQSKIDKMKTRSGTDGSSQTELDMAAKKIVQFGEAIVTLKKRGGQVSDLFFATIREMEDFISKARDDFKVIYYQESTGREKDERSNQDGEGAARGARHRKPRKDR